MSFERPDFLYALVLTFLPVAVGLSRYSRMKRVFYPAAWFVLGRDPTVLARLKGRQVAAILVRMAVLALLTLGFSRPVGNQHVVFPTEPDLEPGSLTPPSSTISHSMLLGPDHRNGPNWGYEPSVQPVTDALPAGLSLAEVTVSPAGADAIVYNTGPTEREATVVMDCSGLKTVTSASVPPMSSIILTLKRGASTPAGECVVSLEQRGKSFGTSFRFEVLPSEATRVVIVDSSPTTRPGASPVWFITSAVRACDPNSTVVTLAQHELSIEALSMADILVLVDPLPMPTYLERAIDLFVRSGHALWVFGGPNLTRWGSDNALFPGAAFRYCVTVSEHPFTIDWVDQSDVAMQDLANIPSATWREWTSLRHVAPLIRGMARVTARFSDSVPAVMRLNRGEGEVIFVAAVPEHDNGDFALHPLFPLMVSSLLKSGPRYVNGKGGRQLALERGRTPAGQDGRGKLEPLPASLRSGGPEGKLGVTPRRFAPLAFFLVFILLFLELWVVAGAKSRPGRS